MSVVYLRRSTWYQTTNAKGCRSTIMSTNIEQIKMFCGNGGEYEQLILLYGMAISLN